tara:strand:+ start:214 stop:345 length:132 start_codon:yes stop_codon:yes gene_type:complete
VITKTKFWKIIKKELLEVERSKKFTKEIMNIIKGMQQDENKGT